MVARLTDWTPKLPPVFEVPSTIPWATPFAPVSQTSVLVRPNPGFYDLHGKVWDVDKVELIGGASGIAAVDVE